VASSVEVATIDAHRGRHAAAAWLLSGLLLTTSTLHFVSPKGFESIVPKFLGSPAAWVYASGVAELICAAAVAIRPTRRRGALACAALFVAVLPANIQMALDSSSGSQDLLHTPLVAWGRLPLQIPLIAWALYVARTDRPFLPPM
jgi:uncharacterized membrane protein